MSAVTVTTSPSAGALTEATQRALLRASFPYFISQLVGIHGRPLELPAHVRKWADHLVFESRIVLLAPRGHGKSSLVLAFVLWCFWRHGRDASGRPLSEPPGAYQAVLFSATRDQALVLMALFRDLLAANQRLFPELEVRPQAGRNRSRSAQTAVRLASGAELLVRAYRTSTRGLHPDLLLLDDVLSDANSLSSRQRKLTWDHFLGTLLPMAPRRFVVVGTAVHQRDLLHQIADGLGAGPDPDHTALGFFWIRYAALLETGEALWPEAFPPAELQAIRDVDPMSFAREFQNDPRDDSGSLFPYALTQHVLDRGSDLTFVPSYRKRPGEFVVLGYDLAVSEEAGADYTVGWVAAYDRPAQTGRILYGFRERGLTFAAQIDMLRRLCAFYGVDLGIVEDNAFQRWLLTEAQKYPETSGRLVGHRTGREKTSFVDGVPSLRLRLLEPFWAFPIGDAECLRLGREWQSEMSAFGWKNGRLEGVGEHDDLVIAWWFLDRAIRTLEEMLAKADPDVIVTAEELGIERVQINPDY
jgi:hypothetical protein